jgi:hypothetical protein
MIEQAIDLNYLNSILNRLAMGEMFVSIPRAHFHYIIELIENFQIDPKKMREVIMPSHAPKEEKSKSTSRERSTLRGRSQ